ncbi:3-dehydroquinate synthase [Gracilinema caldarium]|uniref:3-dehydroquinate synthase n=1 Tax=Gracilinema caldarium (strain ATCC 51460 / DSM 7334 / H1) TaxID=744872 RepID=F8EXL7_GRAC1|nr:3-dehydroquinate synthase family protein [Gracilinema caldarium]AEJ19598.1 3-dehydroquinate synthase [Gracilinema caldarium DSM 7334]
MNNQIVHTFIFNDVTSTVILGFSLPDLERLCFGFSLSQCLFICDANTLHIVNSIRGSEKVQRCVLPSGEKAKNWQSIEQIIESAVRAGIGRDGLFIGVGGGVVTDLAAFAAAIYMRGIGIRLISTTVLGMVDASVGGKTGFDFLGIKNLVGAFYPAEEIYMPLSVLCSLPCTEWKSGFAEIIKTGIIADTSILTILHDHLIDFYNQEQKERYLNQDWFQELLYRCISSKGKIVESDPEERGTQRALLNLGHTYGHALEAVAGLGNVSHGEAIAWGLSRACDLGAKLGITPTQRKEQINSILRQFGYCTTPTYPTPNYNPEAIMQAMYSDKKKKDGQLRFIIPTEESATIRSISSNEIDIVVSTIL